MTTEEHIQRSEQKLLGLTAAHRRLTDLLGMTDEGERQLATRIEQTQEFRVQQEESRARREEFRLHHERAMKEIDLTHAAMNDKLNALIGVVDGFIRRKG
jgi:hypothetical protein